MTDKINELRKARKRLQEAMDILQHTYGNKLPYGFNDAMNSINREIGKCVE